MKDIQKQHSRDHTDLISAVQKYLVTDTSSVLSLFCPQA